MKQSLIITGAAGRMGTRIVALAVESGKFDIVAAVERPGHSELGKDAGLIAGAGEINVKLSSDCTTEADVMIDFSLPQGAEKNIAYCAANNIALVIGTTGLSDQDVDKLQAAGKKIPIVYATNMSVGMNVLFGLVGATAKSLGAEFDIEIVEAHHRFKKDSPSGSALTLAENIAKSTGRDWPGCLVHGRSGKDTLRKEGTIGMHAIRAGDITGDHSVIMSTLGETITLSHTAHNRDNFVRGALRAAQWLIGKPAAVYSMKDVLGI